MSTQGLNSFHFDTVFGKNLSQITDSLLAMNLKTSVNVVAFVNRF